MQINLSNEMIATLTTAVARQLNSTRNILGYYGTPAGKATIQGEIERLEDASAMLAEMRETDQERTTRENIEAISEMPTPEQDAADRDELIKKENRATILAALRLFQDTFEGQDAEQIRASKYADYFQEVDPLCTEDIDFVCEAITFGKVLI